MNPFKTKNGGERTPILASLPTTKDAGGGVVEMRLFDPIDSYGEFWGVSAKEFVAALDTVPDDTAEIRLLINSPGGEVFEGMAILNALRAHPARVVAIVQGIAASSASFIACGADELVMMRNSELFIHNAWGFVMGDAQDLRVAADDLEKHFDRNIADVYAAKSGQSVDHWLAEMGKDRYLTADEAVAEGLADRIEGQVDAQAARSRFDLTPFDRAKHVAVLPPTPVLPSQSEPGEPNRKETVAMSDILKAGISERLGITDADISEEQILAALDETLAEQAAPITSAPAGTVLMDAAALAELRTAAQAGVTALAVQDSARRDQIVASAVKEGRIASSSRETWRAQLEENEKGATALLATLAVNTIPVKEIGHADGVKSASDTLYAAAWGEDDTKEA